MMGESCWQLDPEMPVAHCSVHGQRQQRSALLRRSPVFLSKELAMNKPAFTLASLLLSVSVSAWACKSPHGIDQIRYGGATGIYSRSTQIAATDLSIVVTLGGALFEGNDNRLGRTSWQATDSMMITAVAAHAGKLVFRRQRPIDGDDPCAWFQSSGNASFPSGEVANMTAIVTPFIAEYHHDHPWVWGLGVLPVYMAAGRLKSQAHWQTDVLAGAALGGAIGYLTHAYSPNFTANLLPHGFSIGYSTSF